MADPPIPVLLIVENLPLPFARRQWEEARALAQAGYNVSVICPKGRGFEKSRETVEGIEIYRHWNREAHRPLGYVLEYSWALAAEFCLALRVYARTRFRILHATNPPDTVFLIALFFKLFGVRFIFDHDDLNPELFEAKFGQRGFLYRLITLAERLTYKTADVSIAANESFRQIALTRGKMQQERVFIVRSCPDASALRAGPPHPELKEGRPYLVLFLSAIMQRERLGPLLQIIEQVVKRRGREDCLFVFAGGGPELEALRQSANTLGLAGHLRFTGRIYGEELAAYLSTADVCVAPDPKTPLNDQSTKNKIFEYMAYARPVVLFDLVEGRRQAGDAALYARPNDPADFAARILALLDSEPLRRELGARGRKRIEERFNWKMEQAALLAAYEVALEK